MIGSYLDWCVNAQHQPFTTTTGVRITADLLEAGRNEMQAHLTVMSSEMTSLWP